MTHPYRIARDHGLRLVLAIRTGSPELITTRLLKLEGWLADCYTDEWDGESLSGNWS